MKVVALQYNWEFYEDFPRYSEKITHLVEKNKDADLILFPEYAGCHEKYVPDYINLFQSLSSKYKMYICAGSIVDGGYNRSYIFSPHGKMGYQDKCNLTPDEIKEGVLTQGKELKVFETDFGLIGICICYDSEFPTLVRTLVEKGVKLILVPSYTSSPEGFYRVFLSCRARALENQCYVIQSAMVGQTDTDMTFGAASACSPVDQGFPEDGLLALGKRDIMGQIEVDLDFAKLDKVRQNGQTRNHEDAFKLHFTCSNHSLRL